MMTDEQLAEIKARLATPAFGIPSQALQDMAALVSEVERVRTQGSELAPEPVEEAAPKKGKK